MNNNEEFNAERVDDIPLLLAMLERMGIQKLLDKHFITHGNWQGISLGWVAVVWLSYILSQGDHRLSHVQSWVENRIETLSISTGTAIRALDFSDDRLQAELRYLSDTSRWEKFEQELGGNLLQVYDLNADRVRLDTTSASSYCGVNEQGLFQYGYSKDHRPDLAQIKVMLATLDPLGMPVATDIVAGNKADDPLYCPAITRVRETLKKTGLLYVGDSKMGAIQTRRFIHEKGDYYLVPLSAFSIPESVLTSYLMEREQTSQELTAVYRDLDSGEPTKIAEAFEIEVEQMAEFEGKNITWKERHLVVRSIKMAEAAQKSLKERVQQAQLELAQLNQPRKGKKRLIGLSAYQNEVERIIEKYQVEGLLNVEYAIERKIRQRRAYQGQPAQIIKEDLVTLSVQVSEGALTQKLNRCSWRVYATNSPPEQLSVTDGVLAYRDEYLVEKGFSRLKGFPLSLTPMYLQRPDHITGLIRLLSIGLRLLTLLEFEMRRSLSKNDEKISGIYPGNPKRKTARPSAELLLAAFKEITLVSLRIAVGGNRYLTKFSPVHHQILIRLNIPLKIYTNLADDEGPPPSTSSEPSLMVSHLRE